MNQKQVRIRIRSEIDVTRAILEGAHLAEDIGFNQHLTLMIKTAISELVRNIIKYAGTGQVKISRVQNGKAIGIEVEASDKGPGIEDVEQALTDNFSSGGTLGLGLPGVKRMMDDFSIDTTVGEGTRVLIRKWL